MQENNTISELIKLTGQFADRPDQVQGPGGNVSVKSDDGTMYIKASGFRFEELSDENGISVVNASAISNYFHHVIPSDKSEEEKKMLDVIASNILQKDDGTLYPKPSMETGFHAVLGKYVVHTHSVWSNLINCAANSEELTEALRTASGLNIASIPFVSPGFGLSYLVTAALKLAEEQGRPGPEVFLLANHGIIAHADNAKRVADLLNLTDKCIRDITGTDDTYPSCDIVKKGDDVWYPQAGFISEMINLYGCKSGFFDNVMFPDQTVFFKGQISDQADTVLKINIGETQVFYACGEREAKSVNETLTAYLFLYHNLIKKGIKPNYIIQSDIDYIISMDMEKYRKGLMGEEGR